MKLALIAGHRPSAPGASMDGLSEYPVMAALVEEIRERVVSRGDSGKVVIVDRPDRQDGLYYLIRRLNVNVMPDAVLSLHLNAYEGKSPDEGYAIHWPESAGGRALAQRLTEHVDVNGSVPRSRPHSRDDLGLLRDTQCPAVIDEPAFIDRKDHQEKILRNFGALAGQYADVIDHILRNGLR